jgi:hypothetical protein
MQAVRLSPIYTKRKDNNHETLDNRFGNWIGSLEHSRAGARSRNFWVRIKGSSVSGFVRVALGGLACE